jgi:hypothetical protein
MSPDLRGVICLLYEYIMVWGGGLDGDFKWDGLIKEALSLWDSNVGYYFMDNVITMS